MTVLADNSTDLAVQLDKLEGLQRAGLPVNVTGGREMVWSLLEYEMQVDRTFAEMRLRAARARAARCGL